MTLLDTKHTLRLKKARRRMKAYKSSTDMEQKRPHMSKTYEAHKYELLGLHPGKNTRNRIGCIVKYQLFPVLVTFYCSTSVFWVYFL